MTLLYIILALVAVGVVFYMMGKKKKGVSPPKKPESPAPPQGPTM